MLIHWYHISWACFDSRRPRFQWRWQWRWWSPRHQHHQDLPAGVYFHYDSKNHSKMVKTLRKDTRMQWNVIMTNEHWTMNHKSGVPCFFSHASMSSLSKSFGTFLPLTRRLQSCLEHCFKWFQIWTNHFQVKARIVSNFVDSWPTIDPLIWEKGSSA